jgi:hypothetical protein
MFLALTAAIGLGAYDLLSYQQIMHPKPLATISFSGSQDQVYSAQLVMKNGASSNYQLKGDQWQMDARIFKWPGDGADAAFKSGYRLNRLEGRVYSIDQQQASDRSGADIHSSKWVDVWWLLNTFGSHLGLSDLSYDSVTYMPMAPNAVYKISLSQHGLVSEPFNSEARNAVSKWQ